MILNIEFCANIKYCTNKNKWDINSYSNAQADIDRIKIMLCESCYSSRPPSRWISLKNQIQKVIKYNV